MLRIPFFGVGLKGNPKDNQPFVGPPEKRLTKQIKLESQTSWVFSQKVAGDVPAFDGQDRVSLLASGSQADQQPLRLRLIWEEGKTQHREDTSTICQGTWLCKSPKAEQENAPTPGEQ